MGITKFFKGLFGYWMLAAISAVLALTSIPFMQGTNNGQEMCIYTGEEQANWRFMDMPCKLTDDAIVIFAFGYTVSFLILFAILGGTRLVVAVIVKNALQTYHKQK